MILAEDTKAFTRQALDTVEICRASSGSRSAAYRQYAQWIETGRASGGLALANMLYGHLDRLSSYLFSSTDLRFAVDFEFHHPKRILEQGAMAARFLTREWERKNIDTTFGIGVRESLTYGAAMLKLIGSATQSEHRADVSVHSRLVMPWNFGVFDENINEMTDQEALVETLFLNKHEIWRRIQKLPNADMLYKRILSHGTKGSASYPNSFMHQVLSTAVLNTSLSNATQPMPGGIVQLSNDPNFSTLGPQSDVEVYPMHEIWVKNDDTGDYATIQLIEPDILVTPSQFKRSNLFCAGTLPYGLIQPNKVAGYFWGRSEIVDLMMLQSSLTESLDDAKRLTGLQVDKILAFEGGDGINDEAYGQMRAAGFFQVGTGGKVNDLTPAFPPVLLEHIKLIMELMDKVSGFNSILSGQGEAGVRAGSHANTLLKTGSPRLRDRALLVERQCATLADQTLDYLAAKDARAYYTTVNPQTGDIVPESEFLLDQLPEDRRVVVDSHSGSPIYEQDHQQLIAFGVKAGIVDGESAIELLPFPHKDILIQRHREAEKAKAEMIKQHPELLTKGKGHK